MLIKIVFRVQKERRGSTVNIVNLTGLDYWKDKSGLFGSLWSEASCNCGWQHSIGWGPILNKWSILAEPSIHLLFPHCGHNVTSCLFKVTEPSWTVFLETENQSKSFISEIPSVKYSSATRKVADTSDKQTKHNPSFFFQRLQSRANLF